jgi:hypothetical protein
MLEQGKRAEDASGDLVNHPLEKKQAPIITRSLPE